jgi:hypothetical protein
MKVAIAYKVIGLITHSVHCSKALIKPTLPFERVLNNDVSEHQPYSKYRV